MVVCVGKLFASHAAESCRCLSAPKPGLKLIDIEAVYYYKVGQAGIQLRVGSQAVCLAPVGQQAGFLHIASLIDVTPLICAFAPLPCVGGDVRLI